MDGSDSSFFCFILLLTLLGYSSTGGVTGADMIACWSVSMITGAYIITYLFHPLVRLFLSEFNPPSNILSSKLFDQCIFRVVIVLLQI